MNQAELIDRIAADNEITKAQAKGALRSVVAAISESLAGEGRIAISDLGTFTVGERAAREGRNPTTGEKIQIAASKSAKFKAAPALKTAIA